VRRVELPADTMVSASDTATRQRVRGLLAGAFPWSGATGAARQATPAPAAPRGRETPCERLLQSPGPTTRRSGIRSAHRPAGDDRDPRSVLASAAGGRAEAASRRVSGGLEGTFNRWARRLFSAPLGTPNLRGDGGARGGGRTGSLSAPVPQRDPLRADPRRTASFTLTVPGGIAERGRGLRRPVPPLPGAASP
jgi:hypothetical protein